MTFLFPLFIEHNALALNPDADIHLDLHTVERAYALARARPFEPDTTGKSGESAVVTVGGCLLSRRFFSPGFRLAMRPLRRLGAVQREMWVAA